MTLAEWGAVISPASVVIGMVFTAYWTSRKRAETEAANNAKRDAADTALARELAELRKGLEAAIAEFKVSNDRNAKHELDCAEFRGATVKALEGLASSAQVASTVRERLAVHDERLNAMDDAIEWGTRRFEELFRGQAALSQGKPPPTVALDEPTPRTPARRAPHRSRS